MIKNTLHAKSERIAAVTARSVGVFHGVGHTQAKSIVIDFTRGFVVGGAAKAVRAEVVPAEVLVQHAPLVTDLQRSETAGQANIREALVPGLSVFLHTAAAEGGRAKADLNPVARGQAVAQIRAATETESRVGLVTQVEIAIGTGGQEHIAADATVAGVGKVARDIDEPVNLMVAFGIHGHRLGRHGRPAGTRNSHCNCSFLKHSSLTLNYR
ncbi:MAG: hypothetical protein MAG794_00439 [Gammaproteobacteria bacterium]|nr:hypothetical protein [Gammaproteobacteria bacterium]